MPAVSGATVRNPIDTFVVAQLAARGLRPAPEAPRGPLARRVALDLTGLPLSAAELDAFLADQAPDAYERLLMEGMEGNQALFIRRDEIEQAWIWIDSIQDAWKAQREPPKPYAAGSWGPVASVALLSRDGREWVE